MARPKIQWNLGGFKEMRQSPQMQKLLAAQAKEVADAANADHKATAKGNPPTGTSYEVAGDVTHDRARAFVQTASPRAMRHEATNSSLLRVIAE